MPTSPAHEALVALFRNRPTLAAELLRDVLGAALPDYLSANIRDTERAEAPTASYRADVVVELAGAAGAVAALVVEVQLDRDDDKPFTWPLYVASVRAELRCPTALLVVAPEERVAGWARKPIALGHPGLELWPIVLSTSAIPLVTDRDIARADPELAVLSVLAHGESPRGYDIAVAGLAALALVDEERRHYYTRLILAGVSQSVRERLEAEMRLGNFPEPTDLEKRIMARGEAKGRAEATRTAILTVLTARSIPLSDDARARILACADAATLDRWVERAATVARAEELFEKGEA